VSSCHGDDGVDAAAWTAAGAGAVAPFRGGSGVSGGDDCAPAGLGQASNTTSATMSILRTKMFLPFMFPPLYSWSLCSCTLSTGVADRLVSMFSFQKEMETECSGVPKHEHHWGKLSYGSVITR
jgi:hypothetical protein